MLSFEELRLRAALFQAIREFFHNRQFLEVDTPIRQPILIPEQHIKPIQAEGDFLQTSPELCMKRLLAADCQEIFQICKCFRKEEKGSRHLEEFVMLEWYRNGADYAKLMIDCQELLCHIARKFASWDCSVESSTSVKIAFSTLKKWMNPPQQVSVTEAFVRWSPVSLRRALRNDTFDRILIEYIEPQLGYGQPCFLYDYPTELASLARVKDSGDVVERFELYVDGLELANGFSELTDPNEQRRRFRAELASINAQVGKERMMPEKLLIDLGKIDSAAGIALGVDRLLMLILGKDDINEVVPFAPKDH